MYKILVFLSFFLFLACTNTLKVVEKGQTLAEINQFPSKDTMIAVRDYFITYRQEGIYIVGKVESPFSDGSGNFKSSSSVTIDVSDGKLNIF